MNRMLVGTLVAVACTASRAAEPPGVAGSPRLVQLANEIQAGGAGAVDAFWREVADKAPLIEPVESQPQHRRVTFLWRGTSDTKRVSMIRGLPGPNLLKPFSRVPDTDVWYRTEVHSTRARFQYVFQVNGPEEVPMDMPGIMKALGSNPPLADPPNTRKYGNSSVVELLDAPAQPWLAKRPGVPAGRTTREKIKSSGLNAEYSLSVYTPPGYEPDTRRCWLMIEFDGGSADRDVTLDNLLADGKIPPLVVVGVENISGATRVRDLDCSAEFAAFVAKEVVPWARTTYRVDAAAAHTIIGGVSLGGKMAAYCGLEHPGVFGKVLSQSGTFVTAPRQESPTPLWDGEPPGLLAVQFAARPRLPLEFYLEAGRYETTLPFSPLLETRRLRDVLRAKGYPVTYSEFVGDHNEVCWRGSFADAVMALTAGF